MDPHTLAEKRAISVEVFEMFNFSSCKYQITSAIRVQVNFLMNSKLVEVFMRRAAERTCSQSTFKSKMAALADALTISFKLWDSLDRLSAVVSAINRARQFTIFPGCGMKTKSDLYHDLLCHKTR